MLLIHQDESFNRCFLLGAELPEEKVRVTSLTLADLPHYLHDGTGQEPRPKIQDANTIIVELIARDFPQNI